jgi:hypothetical protein
MKRIFAIAALLLAASCVAVLAIRAPHIPNKVTTDEYAVYSAWTAAHFLKNGPDQLDRLYFKDRTFKFDPIEPFGCGNALHDQSGVSWSLVKQLSALGDAEYGLDFDSPTNLQIPWKYEPVDRAPDLRLGAFHMLSFSRVAFNHEHSQALFAISDACAAGLCGKGGAVFAQKQGDKWVFRGTACNWVY